MLIVPQFLSSYKNVFYSLKKKTQNRVQIKTRTKFRHMYYILKLEWSLHILLLF